MAVRFAAWALVLLPLIGGCSATLVEGVYDCADRRCPAGWACRADHRCWATPDDAGVDGGPGDVGAVDAGHDASIALDDAMIDAGLDAGLDAGSDVGTDAGFDAGLDAGSDVGTDAGSDAGNDAGDDAGHDAAVPPDTGPCVVRLDQSNPPRGFPDGFGLQADSPLGQIITAGITGELDDVVLYRSGLPSDDETVRLDVYDGVTTARPLLGTATAVWAGAPDFPPGPAITIGFGTRPILVAGHQYLLQFRWTASVPMAGAQPRGPSATNDFYPGGRLASDSTRDLAFEVYVCGPP